MNKWHKLALTMLLASALSTGLSRPASAQTKPEGEMRWALYVTLAPAWFDPGEVVPGTITPFWVLYALHDAMVKPMPGNGAEPSLAKSWKVSTDYLVYEFTLREGLNSTTAMPSPPRTWRSASNARRPHCCMKR